MTTLFMSHPSCLDHDTGPGHPERADRIRVIERTFESEIFQMLHRDIAPELDYDALLRVHPAEYIERIRAAMPTEGLVDIAEDVVISPGTWEALSHSVGGTVAAVDDVMRGLSKNAFVAMRPPGHHAETARPMGFCIFNLAAIAARRAQTAHGAERVAIVDFDVHHGNGTQQIFWSDPSVLYASTHQMPLYPGTGALGECGACDTIVNAPLPEDAGSKMFREAMETRILPRVEAFAPDLIVISAGFDGHRFDPVGGLHLEVADFTWITNRLMDIAERRANGRIVSVLEGGYDLEALARCASAHVQTLMGA
ncbi:Acetoin utilization protein [Methylocella tundrae]|uniref:Acetoin utilization protein n=1 Tax=Methylocella tundrae TaxID=227605 RepID=A0A8B6M4B5_METTU|nr:histone deacetylase family protein [Methylocella tundrae]VTZ26605.1 Acetoin utilization protein [Methylocella tundrae]VTZ49857.1 Acetoin utilization protein [Methylocella tundrae]